MKIDEINRGNTPRIGITIISTILAILLLGASIGAAVDGGGTTQISSCTDISSPGNYVLNTTITSTASTCIHITSSNVILDGAGYMIRGNRIFDEFGVHANNSSTELTNITVKNLELIGWDEGISYENVQNGFITNNTVLKNEHGISYENVQDILVTNNIIWKNFNGISLFNSSNNTIYNNYFNNTNNVIFGGTVGSNSWNTTKTAGRNIIGGPNLGGNFWADPNGMGFSQTCQDANNDGICDSPNILNNNNIDYLPLKQDILAYYRGLGNNPTKVETTDLLKAADDWSNNIAPRGFTSPITTQQLLILADEWASGG